MTTKQIQQALASAGFYKGKIDGSYGPQTTAAVKAYQKANGLKVDGKAGPKTQASLGGGGGGAAAAPAAPAGPSIDTQTLAQNYGYTQAVLNSDPELAAVFNQAVSGTWTAERFQAAVQNTGWYQRNGESVRNAAILKAADPATYTNKIAQVKTRLGMQAAQMGAVLSDATLQQYAERAYQFAWDDNQIQQTLATFIQFTDGRALGQAGQDQAELRHWANQMGVKLSDDTIKGYVENIAKGTSTLDTAKGIITSTAASAFPHLKDRLMAGETLQQIADPFEQTLSGLLELNPEAVTLDEPLVRQALATKGADGQVSTQTLYDFENTVRNDKRWLKTQNAQDGLMSTTRKVLTDFGLLGG